MEFISNLINLGSTPTVLLMAFLVCFIGYALGAIKVKGLSLGTAGVFLFALLFVAITLKHGTEATTKTTAT